MSCVSEIPPLVHVTGVTVIGDRELRLMFEDGTVGDVSFAERDLHGVLEPLREPQFFAQVRVAHGTLEWPGELDVAPEALYVQARERQVAAPSVSG